MALFVLASYIARRATMVRSIGFLLLFAAIAMVPVRVSAQATPSAAGCTVTPRSDEELAALLVTPVTPAAPAEATSFPAGDPVDAATMAAIESVVAQVAAC